MGMPIYTLLAQVFEYPGDDFPEHVERACRALEEAYPEPALFPKDIAGRYRVREFILSVTGDVHRE